MCLCRLFSCVHRSSTFFLYANQKRKSETAIFYDLGLVQTILLLFGFIPAPLLHMQKKKDLLFKCHRGILGRKWCFWMSVLLPVISLSTFHKHVTYEHTQPTTEQAQWSLSFASTVLWDVYRVRHQIIVTFICFIISALCQAELILL